MHREKDVELRMNGHDPWPPCGYGRLGLCCSSCLLGPCRLSPFDEAPKQSRCGRSADQQVALNLHQVASAEAIQAIRSLKDIEEASPNREAGPPGRAAERLRPLFPEAAFPHLNGFGIPPESIISFFFDQLEISGTLEGILTKTLCLSTVPLLSRMLTSQRPPLKSEEEVFVLPDPPPGAGGDTVPLIILFIEKGSYGEGWGARIAQECKDRWGPATPLLSVSDIRVFPEIGKRVSRDRHLPVSLTRTLAVVSAPSLSAVLMPLTLGFRVISFPFLPIHGGPGVEAYFSKGVSDQFGGCYLPGREDLSLPVVLEGLGWNTRAT